MKTCPECNQRQIFDIAKKCSACKNKTNTAAEQPQIQNNQKLNISDDPDYFNPWN